MREAPTASLRIGRAALVLGLLMALYYSTVVLTRLHFTMLQIIALWGLVLMLLPSSWRMLTRADAGILLCVTATFLAALISYAANGLWDHPEGNLSRYARGLFFVPIYFVARRFATDAAFWLALLCGTLVTGIWGVLELAGHVRHPQDLWKEVSGGVNPIQFGDLSLTLAAMVCAAWPIYRAYGRVVFASAILGSALAFFACFGSTTRGAWIAIPALAVLICAVFLHHRIIRWRSLPALGLAVVLLSGAYLPHAEVREQIARAVGEVKAYRDGTVGVSVGARLELWRAAWQIYLDHPIVGVGPGLYFEHAQELADKGGYDRKALEYTNPLSEYFFTLATLGTTGLAALLALLLWPLANFARLLPSGDLRLRSLGLAGSILVVGYMHFGLTDGLFFQHATFLGFYLLTIAVLMSSIERRNQELEGDARA